MLNNKSSTNQSGFMNASNQQQLPMQNNYPGMQTHSLLGPGIQQNLNPFMANVQPMINVPAFTHAANNFLPLQNNQLVLPHVNFAGPTTQQGQFPVGFGPQNGGNVNCNQMFPVQGQIMTNGAGINLSQAQGHILAQNLLSMLKQNNMNMNMPNGNFGASLPLQNTLQQLPMQVSNTPQVAPYGMPPSSHPMFGFPNQGPQTMVPQNPFFPAIPQLGLVPQNQVTQVNPNGNNLFPPSNTNAFTSPPPFASQRSEGNTSAPLNPSSTQLNHAKHSQTTFSNSQANPNNLKADAPNSNWKRSPSKNFKNKPNQGGFQGGFQKSRFHDDNKRKGKHAGPVERMHGGFNKGRTGNSGFNSEKQNQEAKRSFKVTYTEQEIQQWREARRRNYPSKDNQKKQSEHLNDSKISDKEVLRRELKEILAKQVELGVEVAEIPSHYLMDYKKVGLGSGEKRNANNVTDSKKEGNGSDEKRNAKKRKFQNKFDRRVDRKDWHSNKQKVAKQEVRKVPTLLQKLLSADIKRDKSHLFQVFRFMVMNSFFKEWPDKPLRYPSVMIKENGLEVGNGEKILHHENDVPECDDKTAVQKIVKNDINDDGSKDDNEDVCIEESDEEEGEIIN